MLQRIIALSGPIAAGKSSTAERLHDRFGAEVLTTKELIIALTKDTLTGRAALQARGAALDAETDGEWVATALSQWLANHRDGCQVLVIDSLRDVRQLQRLRALWPHAVTHVHVTAASDERRVRFSYRRETITFDEASSHAVEQAVGGMATDADLVLDSVQHPLEDVVAIIAAYARLWPEHHTALVDVLVGGQWGSEGKGQVAAHLAPEYAVLVRGGGPNAGHSVFEEEEPDRFHHLPSGTNRNPGARLLLAPGAVLYLPKLLQELQTHEVETARLVIDEQAMVIEDWDREFEQALRAKIASTAQGVGAASARKLLRTREMTTGAPTVRLARDVAELRAYVGRARDVLSRAYRSNHRVLLEGTQGALLSLHHGPYPHVTSRDTTVSGCMSEAGIPPGRVRRRIMVCRSYPIRVGNPAGANSGDMGREISWPEIARRSGIPVDELKQNELTTTTKTLRRVAEFSWNDLAYSAALNSPTDIALTFMDYLGVANRQAHRFEQLTDDARTFAENVSIVGGAPVSLLAVDFSHRAIIDRRRW